MAVDETIVNALTAQLAQHVGEVRHYGAGASENEIYRNLPITYGELIRRTGHNLAPNGIGPHLSLIGERCAADGHPRLDYLVVRKKTGRPGFQHTEAEWKQELIRCFNCEAYSN